MPILDNVTTKSASSVWKSPDGQREIFEVALEYDGKPFTAKTYSTDISVAGWTGTIESYEKPGQNGKPDQTFVKQPQKEGFSGGGGGYKGGGAKFSGDQFTMYLSYAKDIVVAKIAAGEKIDVDQAIQLTLGGGHTLYEGRPGAKPEATTADPEKAEDKDLLSNIDKVFDSPEDKPWIGNS